MAERQALIFNNFTAGEWSPRLDGRVDQAKYYNSAIIIENAIVHPHGGATKRGGSYFIAYAKHSNRNVRLDTFEFNEDQAYGLEWGHQYLRFLYGGAQLVTSVGGSTPYELASPYTEDQIPKIRFAHSADITYISHTEVAPYKLARYGHTAWTLSPVTLVSAPTIWTAGNYPGVTAFYEQRLWFGGTPGEPLTLWGSVSGIHEDFTTGVTEDLALEFTMASSRVNQIQWMADQGRLVVGTLGSEWTGGARSSLDPMTPTNVLFQQQQTYGSNNIPGLAVGNAVLHVGKYGKKVREFAYRYEQDSYVSNDLTLLAEHITGPGLTCLAWAQDPDSTLWGIRSDGVACTGTYYPSEKVMSWQRQITAGEFLSATSIPGEAQDDVYVAVRRHIGGATVICLERMAPYDAASPAAAHHVDCGLSYSGSTPLASLGGAVHLAGETVSVQADGAVHPPVVVTSGGTINLNYAANEVHAGLPFRMKIKTHAIESTTQDGTAQGKLKRIYSAILRLYKSMGIKLGFDDDESTWQTVSFRTSDDPMDSAVPLFTGDKRIPERSAYDRKGSILIVSDSPQPVTVQAVILGVEIGDM